MLFEVVLSSSQPITWECVSIVYSNLHTCTQPQFSITVMVKEHKIVATFHQEVCPFPPFVS